MSANRVAAAVANEWKDETDKVMPAKQQLDERRFLQVLLNEIWRRKFQFIVVDSTNVEKSRNLIFYLIHKQ